MLAPVMIASLTTCVLLMMVGGVLDRFGREIVAGASCPLYPLSQGRTPRAS